MCGIAGIYNFYPETPSLGAINSMINSIIHRGPDFGDVFTKDNIGLGHRRLSIVDLSALGNQPMHSTDGLYTIVFNGEVYNFIEIRNELKLLGCKFISNSDTEVVLKAFQIWGGESLKRFNGMFALAIYNHSTKELLIARDQYGIKPLYFFRTDREFVFSSEIKSLKTHPAFKKEISNQAIVEYLWYGNALGETTIYENVKELGAGQFIIMSHNRFEISNYFDISKINEIKINEEDAIVEIKRLFDNSIKRHLIADVPVGVFLSGGIDSSAITAYVSKHYQGTLNTYSVAFDFQKGPNELENARAVANRFGTKHHEIHIEGTHLKEVVHALVESHDEPFGDAANIPLYLLTQQLKGDIKVVLQGDGGDEFFGGYSRYFSLMNKEKFKYLTFLPYLISLSKTNNTKLLQKQRYIKAINEPNRGLRNALLLTMESVYSNPLQVLTNSKKDVLFNYNPFEKYETVYKNYTPAIDDTQALFYTDTQIILKDTFLEKVDKSTMANSMEIRVPFLDKELSEFMLSIPSKLKVKNGTQKYLLKKAMEDLVPKNILYGPKTGFSVPYQYWLITSLKQDFISLLKTQKTQDWLNTTVIESLFSKLQLGIGNYGFLMWKVYILMIWLNNQ